MPFEPGSFGGARILSGSKAGWGVSETSLCRERLTEERAPATVQPPFSETVAAHQY